MIFPNKYVYVVLYSMVALRNNVVVKYLQNINT